MSYPIYLLFGVAPSLIWLGYYLRKDSHPEPNRMILKIFIYGMLSAFPAVLLELGFFDVVKNLTLPLAASSLINTFLGIALVEEGLKYLVVKHKVLNSACLDEPLDIMLYMIIAGLGFAALENILVFFALGPKFLMGETLSLGIFRFLGATFLHALSSGLFGFFIALSFCQKKNRKKLFLTGLLLATALHGLFNFIIINVEGNLKIFLLSLVMLILAVSVACGFQKLKQLKGACQIES